MPICRSTSRANSRKHQRRRLPVQPLGAGEVEECLVDRKRLDQRRQRLHHGPHLAADAHIFLHVRRDHDRLGAGFQRLEHRHRRANALDAGDVAGRRHDAALAAADDHGPVLQFRIVALFDSRIEGVAVDMREMQPLQARDGRSAAGCRMPRNAGRPPLHGEAVTAETVLQIVDRHAHGCEHNVNIEMVFQPPPAGNRTT